MIHEEKRQAKITRTEDDSQKATEKTGFKHVLESVRGSQQ